MSIDINLCCYNTLILKYPYDGKDDYTKKAKDGVLYGENLDSRYGQRIADKIIQLNCDCIALQEVNQASFNKLAEKLWQRDYTGIFSNRNNGEDEGLAIFYKNRRFDLASNYTHYFNDSTGRGILDIGLKLKDHPNVLFHVMTSHIDYRSAFMEKEFTIFADYSSQIEGPKIVCGDFNVTPDNPILWPMWNKQLNDSLYGKHAPTFFDRRIDYILTSPEIAAVLNSKVIGDPRKLSTAEEPSDHLPLVATIQLRAPLPIIDEPLPIIDEPLPIIDEPLPIIDEPLPTIDNPHVDLPISSTMESAFTMPPVKKTQILVKCDTGIGNKLFIRGTGPKMDNWEKGIELRNIDKDTWIFETENDLPSFKYKIVFNDKNWETGDDHNIECSKKQEIKPKFF